MEKNQYEYTEVDLLYNDTHSAVVDLPTYTTLMTFSTIVIVFVVICTITIVVKFHHRPAL